jgi:ankyrin repeat protein
MGMFEGINNGMQDLREVIGLPVRLGDAKKLLDGGTNELIDAGSRERAKKITGKADRSIQKLQEMIEGHPDLTQRVDDEGNTLLHHTLKRMRETENTKRFEIILEILSENGADWHAKNREGKSAAEVLMGTREEIGHFLYASFVAASKIAIVSAIESKKITPDSMPEILSLAAARGEAGYEIVEAALQSGFDPNYISDQGVSPLSLCPLDHFRTANLLVENGAFYDPQTRSNTELFEKRLHQEIPSESSLPGPLIHGGQALNLLMLDPSIMATTDQLVGAIIDLPTSRASHYSHFVDLVREMIRRGANPWETSSKHGVSAIDKMESYLKKESEGESPLRQDSIAEMVDEDTRFCDSLVSALTEGAKK